MECHEWQRNEEVHIRARMERELASRADPRVLRWFGHVERMDENRMARMVFFVEVSGIWMDGVKGALGNRGMMLDAA